LTESFTITLRPEPGVRDPVIALRSLLKVALRQHGLKCVKLAPAPKIQPQPKETRYEP
jgi:hypothetical protein